ncbi:MAG: protease inhibitor I42 family protein [Leptospirales bacterium]|nr:protease inhibitor I42 family protein [Leptospirales bacterium]
MNINHLKRVIFAAAAVFFSCSSNLVISDENNGSSQAIELGKVIEVKLDGQISTGFIWEWVSSDFFTQEDAPKIIPVDKKPGGHEFTVFTLKAVKAGQTKLLFKYHRQWEKKQEFVKEYSVNVIINEGKK